MLWDWEWRNPDVLGPNLLAYLILQETQEVKDETQKHSTTTLG